MITKLKSLSNKKAQSWYMDFIIATTIIVIIGIIFVKLVLDFSQETGETQDLIEEAKSIGNALMNPGYNMNLLTPTSTLKDEIVIGITDNTNNQKIDTIKLDKLKNYINSKYEESKIMLGTKTNYFVYISDKDGNIQTTFGYTISPTPTTEASIDTGLATLGIKNLARLSRIVCYGATTCKVSRMVVLTW